MKTHSAQYRAAVHPENAHWKQLRWARYRAQHGRCAVCRLRLGLSWHLHHRHYRTLGHESLFDVCAVHPWPCHPLADAWRRWWRWFWNVVEAR